MGWLLLIVIGIAIYTFYSYSKSQRDPLSGDPEAVPREGTTEDAAPIAETRIDDSGTGAPTGTSGPATGSDGGSPGGTPEGATTSSGSSHSGADRDADATMGGKKVDEAGDTGSDDRSLDGAGAEQVGESERRDRAERHGVATGDMLRDIRESINILNLRASDAGRLAVDESTFEALKKGEPGGLEPSEREAVLARLHGMLS